MRAGIASILFTTSWPIGICPKTELIILERGVEGGPRIRALIVGIRREDRLESFSTAEAMGLG